MVTAGLEAMMNRQYNNQGEKWTALYVRLSRDDENEGDSNSIQHQIEILTKYCKDHAISRYQIYKDDGFSGTNFKRPGFLDMIGDIEAGLVNMVIVKDMSRFGRNYLEVGLYTEIRFPEMGVRFIAVNDGVDSDDQMGNDFTPFRNIINEWYAKDTSKKIRAVFRNKGMSGQRLAVNAPYGYIKGEDGHLLVDEETAPVVELIFQLCVEGNGPGKIARMLKEREIPTPGTITFQRTGQTSRYFPDDPCRWNPATVLSILGQDAYLGRTTNFKTTKLSYKSKKTVINSPDKWAVFEGTHEAIIDKETWEIVQKSREHRRRPTKMGEMGLFSGLAYCADCGAKLYHHRSITLTKEQESYICSNYQSRKKCTAHYIRAVVLEQLVLQNLQRVVAYAQEDENEFVRRVMENKTAVQRAEQEQAKRKLEKQERRISELDRIIQQLYEDRVSGALSAERFAKLSGGYEKEQEELKQSAKELQAIVNTIETQAVNVQSFLKIVRKYTAPTELTPALLREFVEKIVVHAPDKSSGHRTQRIDVHYNFIGEIDFSPEYSQVSRQTTA
jgi:DNA invertase Pin-like site-specific DNA recombinase